MASELNFVIDAKYQAESAFRRARGDINSLDSSAKNASGTGGGLFSLQGILGKGLIVAAGAATAAIGGIAVAVASSTSKAADLEEQMSGIAAVMGKTREEIEPLQDLILKLGIDPTLKVSATEAADAIQMLARNGLSMSEIMEGAARNTVLLANSTGADFSIAADIATDTMSLFNIEAKDMGQAVNGITSVVNNSKFSIDDYRLALAQGGGVAATVGVTFDDFNATMAGIAPLFASGSDAGTSFKVMLQRLNPQSKEATRLMSELGIITEDGSNQFFDANGNMRSMTEIAGVLNRAMSGLSDSQRSNALSTIFGTDAMRAAAGIAELGEEKFAQLKNTMGNTDAETAAATRVDNLRGSMEILSGIIETLQLRIGDKFVPVIRRMIDAFSDFLNNNSDQIVAAFDAIARHVETLINWVVDLISNGGNLTNWFSSLQPVLLTVMNGFLLISNTARDLWTGLLNLISPITLSIQNFQSLSGVLDGLKAAFWNIVDAVQSSLPQWRDTLASWANAAWEWITNDAIPKVREKLGLWASELYQYIIDNLPQWRDKLTSWGKAAGDWISNGETINNLRGKLGDWKASIFSWMDDNKPKAIDFVDWATGIVEWIGEAGPKAIDALADWIISLIDWISGDGAAQIGTGLENNQDLIDAFSKLDQAALKAFENIIDSLANAAGRIVWAIVGGFIDALVPGGEDIRKSVETFFTSLWNWIKGFFGVASPSTRFYTLSWNIWQGFIDGFNARGDEVFRHIASVFSNLFDTIAGVLSFETLKQHGQSLMDGLKEGVVGKVGELTTAITTGMQGVSQQIKSFFGISSPSKMFVGFGEELMNGMAIGIQSGATGVQNAMGAASLNIAGAGASVTNSVTNSTSNAFNISLPSNTRNDSRTESQIAELANILAAVAI